MEQRTRFSNKQLMPKWERMNLNPYLTPQKINLKWITDLNGTVKTIKLLE